MAKFEDVNTKTLEAKTIVCDTLKIKNILQENKDVPITIKASSLKIDASSIEIHGSTIIIKGDIEVDVLSPKKNFSK